jgi:transcriptional regulator with XRE-family HTH domain
MARKATNLTDKHVGNRVRMRRMILKMSQEKLATGLGLTFQQVQKYEKGANRIGASRLQEISNILQVPVAFFFEGGPQAGSNADDDSLITSDFMATSDGLALMTAFAQIKNPTVRQSIVQLVEGIASEHVHESRIQTRPIQ